MAPLSTLTRDQLRDRIRGCLYGNAVGDAYGLATEFMTTRQAQALYGNGPIAFGTDPGWPVWEDHHRLISDRNDFTDDTDQMLIMLQSLEATHDGKLHPTHFAKKMLEWNDFGFPELGTPSRGIGYTVGSVMNHSLFRTNPHRAAYEVWDREGRDLAPNGAVMRTAVVGIESFWDEQQVVLNALGAAKITHADPRSIIAALVSSVLISRMLRGGGQDPEADSNKTWNPSLGQTEYRQGLLQYLQRGTDSSQEAEEDQAVFNYKDFEGLNQARLQEEAAAGGNYKDQFKDRLIEDWNLDRPKAVYREDNGWAGIDFVGADPGHFSLARSVVEDYKFLLLETDLVPPAEITEDGQPQLRTQEKWLQELENSCFPQTMAKLDLGSSKRMGYAYKCIGISVYGVTRAIDPKASLPDYEGPEGLFRGLMEQVTLQAGDADTNCAVMGSLLGARFGLQHGVPDSWWSALQHHEFLERTINAFADRVLDNFEAHQARQ